MRLLGPMRAEAFEDASILPRSRKTRALLAYLCLAEGRPVPRARLAGQIWERVTDAQARVSLRQALLDIGRAMGSLRPELLDLDRDTIRLRTDRCWIDALAFRHEPACALEADAADFPPERLLSSSSVVGQRMAVSLGVERSNRFVDGAVEVIRAGERLMSEVMPLQVAPETLDIVQLRSIFRQPLDGEPGGALGERGAACLAGVDRAVVQDEHEGLDRNPELGPIAPIDLLQESDEVRASFGPAGVNNELALRRVEHPEHRHFRRLARRRNAQFGPSLGPDVRQVRMGERFGLVAEEQHDVTGLSLRFEQLSAQALPVHGIRILAALQRVAGSPPAEAP